MVSRFTRICSFHKYLLEMKKFSSPFSVISNSYASNTTFNVKGKSIEPEDIRDLRNIGIIAHIDAGKTTTTERMLYYSGLTRHLGDVDHGDTVTDYMEEERERGITISSAAITYHWKKHRVNLIDTPGHVDFTIEVERSLRVLDGAVTILDSSAGVEAQTLTVWKQAEKHAIPSVFYLNKLDKPKANIDKCMSSIMDKLHIEPFLINFPYGEDIRNFQGLVDVVDMVDYKWDLQKFPDGSKFTKEPLTESGSWELWEKAMTLRDLLIGKLSESDEKIADEVLLDSSFDQIKASDVRKALRDATIHRHLVPVLCGSSLKNKGVQLLMNAIYDYLPSPNDRDLHFLKHYGTDLCGLAFKTIHTKQKRPLTFFRIYSGHLNSGADIYNVNQKCKEKVKTISRIYADEFHDISCAYPGDIVCVSGLSKTITGDTVTSNETALQRVSQKIQLDKKSHQVSENDNSDDDDDDFHLRDGAVLAGLHVPSPVFFCSIEPPSMAFQKDLDNALECLQREDPTLKVEINRETSQTVLSGMGELHLEVIKHRLLSEFKIDAYMGPLQIAYRETLNGSLKWTETMDNEIGGNRQHVIITMTISSSDKESNKKNLQFVENVEKPYLHTKRFKREYRKAIKSGVDMALSYGPILGFPVIDVEIIVTGLEVGKGTSENVVSACTSKCIHNAFNQGNMVLLEPLMKMEIHTQEDHMSEVMKDLSVKRAMIEHITQNSKDDWRSIRAIAPLSELKGYSTQIRKITSGQTSFSMEFSHYEQLGEVDKNKAIEAVTGFAPV